MNLEAIYLKENQRGFSLFENEIIIISNTISTTLFLFYLYYEILSYLLNLIGFQRLPYTRHHLTDNLTGSLTTICVKVFLLVALIFGLWGSVSWKFVCTICNLIILIPYCCLEIFYEIKTETKSTDPNDFLLFQKLYTTILSISRFITMIANIIFLLHYFGFPSEVSFDDLL